jgi:hypothetical protein
MEEAAVYAQIFRRGRGNSEWMDDRRIAIPLAGIEICRTDAFFAK